MRHADAMGAVEIAVTATLVLIAATAGYVLVVGAREWRRMAGFATNPLAIANSSNRHWLESIDRLQAVTLIPRPAPAWLTFCVVAIATGGPLLLLVPESPSIVLVVVVVGFTLGSTALVLVAETRAATYRRAVRDALFEAEPSGKEHLVSDSQQDVVRFHLDCLVADLLASGQIAMARAVGSIDLQAAALLEDETRWRPQVPPSRTTTAEPPFSLRPRDPASSRDPGE
jgi:hypothetical protein